jgi:hypothetical protein
MSRPPAAWVKYGAPPPTKPLPGYEWLLMRAFNSYDRNTFLRLISSKEMKSVLESLSKAPLKDGVERKDAIYSMLHAASIPEQMFLGTEPKHWPSIQKTHLKVANKAQELRRLLGELNHFDVSGKAEREWNSAMAPNDPYRVFHADRLISDLDAYLERLAWACELPHPPATELQPRKRADPLDAALTLKQRLLKREVRKYCKSPQWDALAVMVEVSLGVALGTTAGDNVAKA